MRRLLLSLLMAWSCDALVEGAEGYWKTAKGWRSVKPQNPGMARATPALFAVHHSRSSDAGNVGASSSESFRSEGGFRGQPSAASTSTNTATPPPFRGIIFGFPKLAWAFVADFLAMLLVCLCIPLVLTCSKRRRPGDKMFAFGGPSSCSSQPIC